MPNLSAEGAVVAKNVLLVDDEKGMLLVLKKAFEAYRDLFNVKVAYDGEEALEVLRESGDISLVVTDLIMPRMDGFTLLVNIRTDFPEIPVIIMTGHSRPVMERMAWKIGVAEYIEKPFDIKDLIRKIVQNLGAGETMEESGIQGMSIDLFIQLIELEKKTCKISLVDISSKKEGELRFEEGEMVEAKLGEFTPEQAAGEMRSWKNAKISIHESPE
jgi:CheY-like chemotaxis protein